MYGKILVPVDGSETSTRGLNEAIKIADAQGSQLRLVHIVNEFIFDTVVYKCRLTSSLTWLRRSSAFLQASEKNSPTNSVAA